MQKIRIKIKGYDHKVLDKTLQQIIETAVRTGAKTVGPIPLPTRRKVWSVLKSPHADGNSKEHYEMRIHKRIVDILNPTERTIDSLTHLQVAAGVSIEIK